MGCGLMSPGWETHKDASFITTTHSMPADVGPENSVENVRMQKRGRLPYAGKREIT